MTIQQHEIEIRVRYQETDAMGFVHHSTYFVYFEMGRVELLRAAGISYRELEEQGIFMVVFRIQCRYHRPARYDDLLRLRTRVTRVAAARIEHEYHVYRGQELVAEGQSVLACVDRSGTLQRMPEWLRRD